MRTEELPAGVSPRAPASPVEPEQAGARLGVSLQTLTPALARQVGVDDGARGAVVVQVRPGSRAEEAGLRQGVVIVEVNREAVTTAEDAVSRLGAGRNGGHLVRVLRGNGALYLAVPETVPPA